MVRETALLHTLHVYRGYLSKSAYIYYKQAFIWHFLERNMCREFV